MEKIPVGFIRLGTPGDEKRLIEIINKLVTKIWTTTTRPTPPSGQYPIGFNTTTSQFEGWNGAEWVILG